MIVMIVCVFIEWICWHILDWNQFHGIGLWYGLETVFISLIFGCTMSDHIIVILALTYGGYNFSELFDNLIVISHEYS